MLLLLAMVAAMLLFLCLRFGGAVGIEYYFNRTGFQQKCNEKRIVRLQKYIDKYNLSTKDTNQITKWVRTQPLMLLELYRSNILVYTSYAPEEMIESDMESPHYSWASYYELTFSDGQTDAVIYADDTYRFFSLLTIISLCLSVLMSFIVFLHGCQSLIKYICKLNNEIQAMEGGNLEASITIWGEDELSSLARSLDSMRKAFKEQKERETEMLRANQTMITQMSHDLKTPMTVLQLYIDILKYNRCKPEQISDYMLRIERKVAQMKQLADNLFEYSLVSRAQIIVLEQPCSFRDAVHDLLSESIAYLSELGFQFDLNLDWPEVTVRIFPPYMKRVMDNVTSNIAKYAKKGSQLKAAAGLDGNTVFLLFQNEIQTDSPVHEGSQIGLSNVRIMMEKMNGECRIRKSEMFFCLELRFPCSAEEKPDSADNLKAT